MEISLILLQEIFKLFLIMVMGFVLIRTGKLKASDGRALSILLVYLILPCVIIHSFQIEAEDQVKTGLLFALGASVAVHVIFIILTALLRPALRLKAIEQASLIYTNAGILVFPLIIALLGTQYVIYPCTYMVVQLTLLWTHGSHLLCEQGEVHFKNIIGNINILAIIAGAVLFIFQIKIPPLLDQTMNSVGMMIGPVGMLITGMAIADCNLKEIFCKLHNYLPVLLRLVAYPFLLVAIFAGLHMASFIDDGKAVLMTIFIASITPTAAVVTSMAELYDQDPTYSAELCVLSTVLSIGTMPALVFVFQY
uniref:AEC family transporter n=1 Tax=uncultured Megasphaera sp. TaxID=165188 RepID=UPI002659723F